MLPWKKSAQKRKMTNKNRTRSNDATIYPSATVNLTNQTTEGLGELAFSNSPELMAGASATLSCLIAMYTTRTR